MVCSSVCCCSGDRLAVEMVCTLAKVCGLIRLVPGGVVVRRAFDVGVPATDGDVVAITFAVLASGDLDTEMIF